VRLSERYRNQSLKCKTCLILSMFLNHWSRPLREADVFDEEGQLAGMESGEFQFVGYILSYGRTHNRFHRGDDLAGIFADLGAHLRFAQKARHNLSADNLQAAGRVLLSLMGERDFARLYGDMETSEEEFIANCLANRSQSALGFYHTAEAFRHYLLGEHVAARLALEAARPLLSFVKGLYTEAAFVFCESLLLLATYEADGAPEASRKGLKDNRRLLANWAAHSPGNFRHQLLLIEAELARVENRPLDAMEGYDRAIEAALDAGFKQNEALAHELAGRFWLGRGKADFAALHLERAAQGYRAWGAMAKELAFRLEFPALRTRSDSERYGATLNESSLLPTRHSSYLAESTRVAINNLDLASVLKASQAISGEIDLDSLLQRLLRILIESAGAASGCVLLERGEGLIVAASIASDGTVSREPVPLARATELSQAIVQYVLRSGESLLLADAAREGLFTTDPHVKQAACRSLLCMPIRNGGALLGVLYLENRQTAGAFPTGRMGLLNILAAQAAISIQNALLYTDLVAEVELHRLAVAELRAKEAQYRAVFENAADGIFRVAPDGRLLLVNPALATMLGFTSPTQMIDYAAQPGIGQFLPTEMQALLLQHFNRDGAIRNVEFRATRRDGTLLELLVTGHVARDDNGTVQYYEGVIQDVTARKRVVELKIAKEAAEAAARAKGEFLANMSHEIRTPMTAILGFTTLALKQEVPPRIRDYLCKIDKAGQSLLGVINDILDFSKMDAGFLQLEAIAFNLPEVLTGLHDMFTEQAKQKGIRYEVLAEPNVPAGLIGDPTRLNQILVNLVSNAIKFTEQGAVTVRVRADDQGDGEAALCFAVRDSGIGMAQENVERLFQAFYQADTSTTRQYGGTGLGLTISRNLVELMGGDIVVTSELGEGTEFVVTILFPIASANVAPQAFRAPTLPRDNPRGDRSWRVLLVEDNIINQQVATELLAGAGYNVDVAGDGVEAVRQTEAADYDVVLMDIQMPEMDGYAATKRIRTGARQPDVPIIAMTAHAIAGYREQCLAQGMNDYVSKPISPPELYKVLARWCTIDATLALVSPKPAAVEVPEPGIARFAGLAPHIEVAEIWKHVAGKPNLLIRLLQRFVQSVESGDDALRAALREGDLETASRLVHTVKGMAGTLGATRLRELTIEFEAALEADGVDASAEIRGRYFDCTRHLRLHVAQFLADQGEEPAPASGS
jgi:PAS domain S-box-containing protein